MDKQLLHDCLQLALEGKQTFPETVKQMMATGVERYRADLVQWEKCHYSPEGESHVEKIRVLDAPALADDFSQAEVTAAIAAIQQRRIDYSEFLRRIVSAGTAEYSVYLAGRKAIYIGRNGEFHIEHFLSATN